MAPDQVKPHRRQQVDGMARDLLDAAPDAMVVVDADGIIVLVNSQVERLFGYAREELLGRPVEELIPQRFRAAHPGHRAHYGVGPRNRPMGNGLTLHARRKDGSEFPVEISLSPVESDRGTLVTAAVRDVTAQKALEAQLRRNLRAQEASRLKSEFLANMSHELRTPLNAIIGFAELMHDARVGPVSPDHKEYLGDILSSSRHLLQLINDVLDLAKVEAGKIDLHPEPVDLVAAALEARDVFRAVGEPKQIAIDVMTETGLSSVVADPAKLKQVLYNYLSNALKFTPAGGRVSIRFLADGDAAFRLEVEDTGIGIKADDLKTLFVEFQQLDASASKRYAGTGLGLALTKRIVEAQGGQVGATSVPGHGSIFFAVLPRDPVAVTRGHDEGARSQKGDTDV
jgi:PAS domain S-box-containing protein